MDVVLGLDISTSVIGWAFLDVTAKLGDLPISFGHFDLRKVNGFWSKVDSTKNEVEMLVDDATKNGMKIVSVFVENPVKRFRSGHSSASTIGLLAKFNAMVSYFVRQKVRVDPLYVGATAARKHIGLNLMSKKKSGGLNEKQQTFDQLSKSVFISYQWPLNRNMKVQPFCYDEVDAYVVCMAGVTGCSVETA